MYLPDRCFMTDLHRLDKRLGVKFNGQTFIITYNRGYDEPVNLWVVKREDGGFRQPDRRDLEALCQGDLNKERWADRWQQITHHMYHEREKLRERSHDFFHHQTADNKTTLLKAFGKARNDSKSNAAFRRVETKPKPKIGKQVFDLGKISIP